MAASRKACRRCLSCALYASDAVMRAVLLPALATARGVIVLHIKVYIMASVPIRSPCTYVYFCFPFFMRFVVSAEPFRVCLFFCRCHFLPLSKFRNYCQISAFRGVRRCSLRAVLQVLEKSRQVCARCLCAVYVNHCKTFAPFAVALGAFLSFIYYFCKAFLKSRL